jgi:phospholipid/cholesterol/gamma-HCH transport system substrate-binding protein
MSRELKVGAFVLVSVAIFMATFMYVASVQVRGDRIRYKTYFKYAGGVDPGSPVRFGGMKAGAITAIHPSPEDPTKIEVLFEIKQGVPVNADSVAMLTSLSPLGDKYLEITTGTDKARRLPGGATIPSTEPVSIDDLAKQASAVIPTVQSTLQDVQRDIDQLTGDARVVLTNFQSMTGPQNQRNLTLLLSNTRELLDKESPRIDRVLQNVERASSQASDTLDQIHTAARNANDTISNANRTIDEIRDPVKTDLAELQRTMTDARGLIADLNAMVSSNRSNINDTLENFRAASENLRDFTSSVKQQPWMLIRGKPAPDRAVPVARKAP